MGDTSAAGVDTQAATPAVFLAGLHLLPNRELYFAVPQKAGHLTTPGGNDEPPGVLLRPVIAASYHRRYCLPVPLVAGHTTAQGEPASSRPRVSRHPMAA